MKKALENKVSEEKKQETAPSNVKESDFTKLVEKESISEIQYSKKAEFKKRLINSLYIYIIFRKFYLF